MNITREQVLKDLENQKKLIDLYNFEMSKSNRVDLIPDPREAKKFIVRSQDIPMAPKKGKKESTADYEKRLDEWKLNNQDVLIKYYESEKDTLRKNLKEIVGNDQQINDVMTTINDEDLYFINRYWKRFVKSIEDNFTSISLNDLVNVIQQMIDIIKAEPNKNDALKNLDIVGEVGKYSNISEYIQSTKVPVVPDTYEGFKIPEEYKDIFTESGRLKSALEMRTQMLKENARLNREKRERAIKEKADYKQAQRDDAKLRELQKDIYDEENKLLQEIDEADYYNLLTKEEEAKLKEEEAKLKEADMKIREERRLAYEKLSEEEKRKIREEKKRILREKLKERLAEKEKGLRPPIEVKPEEITPEEAVSSLENQEEGLRFADPQFSIDEVNNMIMKGEYTKDKSLNKLIAENKKNNKIFKDVYTDLLDENNYDEEALKILKNNQISKENYIKYYGPRIVSYKNQLMLQDKTLKQEDVNKITRPIFGVGLNRKKLQPIVFGRYLIDEDKLNNRNLLHIFHNSGNNVKYFRATYISEDMKDLINYILRKKSFNYNLFKLLSEEEKDMMKELLDKSKLGEQLNIKLGSSKHDDAKNRYHELKKEYMIISSEIDQGNDNPKLQKDLNKIIKELKQLITHLSKVGEISKRDATNLILSL
jgi:hypothetical protein